MWVRGVPEPAASQAQGFPRSCRWPIAGRRTCPRGCAQLMGQGLAGLRGGVPSWSSGTRASDSAAAEMPPVAGCARLLGTCRWSLLF